jgi:small conductance mechanosensitive channel
LKFHRYIQVSLGLIVGVLIPIMISGWNLAYYGLPTIEPSSIYSIQPGSKVYRLGNLEYTPLMLDGRPLFSIASRASEEDSALSPVRVRAQIIEDSLYQVIREGFDPETFKVVVGDLNQQTVILAYDAQRLPQQVLLTVTSADARVAHQPIEYLAEEWADILQKRLVEALAMRQPVARQQQLLNVMAIALIILVTGIVLEYLRWWLRCQLKTLQKTTETLLPGKGTAESVVTPSQETPSQETPSQETPSQERRISRAGVRRPLSRFHLRQDFLLLLMQLLRFAQLALAITGIVWGFNLFPETRILGRWFLTVPLQILVIWLVMSITVHITYFVIKRSVQDWVDQSTLSSDDPERILLRAPTIVHALKSISNLAAWAIGFVWLLTWQNVSLSSILTGAGLLGVALSVVFQNLLRDWVNGILVVLEDQYTVGDMIDIDGVFGSVEDVGLRTVQLRTAGGRLSVIPHGQTTVVHNHTKDWARVDFTIEIAYETDATLAMQVMEQVANEMAQDPAWQTAILQPKMLLGVNRVEHTGIQLLMWLKTRRWQQWEVEREFRRRLKEAFEQKGIKIGVPQRSLSWHQSEV